MELRTQIQNKISRLRDKGVIPSVLLVGNDIQTKVLQVLYEDFKLVDGSTLKFKFEDYIIRVVVDYTDNKLLEILGNTNYKDYGEKEN